MFENVKIKGVHASRYIASWVRKGGKLTMMEGLSDFGYWLESLGLTEEEIDIIYNLASNGRLELETSAMIFMQNKDKYSEPRRSCREEA